MSEIPKKTIPMDGERKKENQITITEGEDGEGRSMISIGVKTADVWYNAHFSAWQGADVWRDAAQLFREFIEKNANDDGKIRDAFSAYSEWDSEGGDPSAERLKQLLENPELVTETMD